MIYRILSSQILVDALPPVRNTRLIAMDETGQLYLDNGTAWVPIGGGGGGAVASVFGRTGAVVAQQPDYAAFYQPLDADLTALAALATMGLVARTGAATYTPRTIVAGAGVSVVNGDGVAGNPTITMALGGVGDNQIAFGAGGSLTGAAALMWDAANARMSVLGLNAVWGGRFTDPRPGTLQVTAGSLATPITTLAPVIYASSIVESGITSLNVADQPAVIRADVRRRPRADTTGSTVMAGLFQAANDTSNNDVAAVVASVASFAAGNTQTALAAVCVDQGFAVANISAIEGRTVGTHAGRVLGQTIACALYNQGTGSLASDIGLLVGGSGYGWSIRIATPDSTVNAAHGITFQAGQPNTNTVLLDIEAGQTNAFLYGLDFFNATFSGALIRYPYFTVLGTGTVFQDTFASAAIICVRRANGVVGAPSAVQNGDVLGSFQARGYGASAYATTARGAVRFIAAETWTNAAQGTRAVIQVVAPGGTTAFDALTVAADGGVQVAAPTGGSQGPGTINVAVDIFKNGVAYANPDYILEHWATGRIEHSHECEGAQGYAGLRALPDVEDFVRRRYRLPHFAEPERLGLFSGGDALLASVEEAYLYLFDHERRLRALEARHDG